MHKFGGSWSESKLGCIESYTLAYLKVMQNQTWCKLDYVDAFAGRGKQELKSTAGTEKVNIFGDDSDRAETIEFLLGSAIRALHASTKSMRSFNRFTFIDADAKSCAELKSMVVSDFPYLVASTRVICGDANKRLHEYVSTNDWAKTRSLVFLDPYGLEVGWAIINELAATKACDVWYLFPLGGVIRMMTNDGQIPEAWAQRLNGLFGTHDWYDEFYKPSPQPSLFNNNEVLQKDASTKHVVDYIRSRLSMVFAAVSNVAILRNSKGAPLFALILGVSNPSPSAQKRALSIANHLVKDLSNS